MPVVVVLLVIAVVVGGFLISQKMAQKRLLELGGVAANAHLGFDAVDTTQYDDLGFSLFRQGDRRKWYDVMYDSAAPSHTRVFEYWYETTSTSSNGRQQQNKTYHTCCVFEVEVMCPRLHISKENIFTRFADHLGMADIDFESEEFNHEFNVKSTDQRFASAVVDPLMMQWLLDNGSKCSFELNSTWGLLVSHHVKPLEMPGVYSLADQFRRHIPTVVASLYPRNPQDPP